MKIIALCFPGTEDICATEIRELCGVDSSQHESAVIFELNEAKVLNYCYMSQTPTKVLGFLGMLKFNSLEEILDYVKKIKLIGWTNKNTTFKVKCTRSGEHKFSSETIMQEVGEIFYEKDQLKVVLDNPEILIYVYIHDNNCYIGIDLTLLDLSKRDYKMFSSAETIKCPIAYSMVRIADYNEKDVLLNPATGSGAIEIEAALFMLQKSVNFYRKNKFCFERLLPFKETFYEGYFDELDNIKTCKLKIYGYASLLSHVKYAQKNAKIAGVDKDIHNTKIDIEWLDTKFEKQTVNKLVTYLPCPSKRRSEHEIIKIYKELFYQIEYILNQNGLFVALTQKNELLKKMAEENKLRMIHERIIMQGKTKFWLNVFEKQASSKK